MGSDPGTLSDAHPLWRQSFLCGTLRVNLMLVTPTEHGNALGQRHVITNVGQPDHTVWADLYVAAYPGVGIEKRRTKENHQIMPASR
jgi:hypothetical protein